MRCESSERSYTNQGEWLIYSRWSGWFLPPNVNGSVTVVFDRPIILTVAKCWDPAPQGYFTLPRSKYMSTSDPPLGQSCSRSAGPPPTLPVADEPIRPIDPAAWVSHSVAMTGAYPPYPGSSSLSTITSSSSVTETERECAFQTNPVCFTRTMTLLFQFIFYPLTPLSHKVSHLSLSLCSSCCVMNDIGYLPFISFTSHCISSSFWSYLIEPEWVCVNFTVYSHWPFSHFSRRSQFHVFHQEFMFKWKEKRGFQKAFPNANLWKNYSGSERFLFPSWFCPLLQVLTTLTCRCTLTWRL